MITNRHAAAHTLGISIGATNLVATSGSQAVVHPAVLRTAQGGWLSGFVDRIGDPVPLVASDGSTHRPEALLTEALEVVTSALPNAEMVSDVAVTVPAHWPSSVVDALRTSLPRTTRLVPDATAALRALRANPGLPSRGVVAVCDFGGSGTSITLVDATANYVRIGETVRLGDFSGDLIDGAILRKVVAELGAAGQTDPSGTAMVGSLTRLREACKLAKHRLSADTAAAIAVDLPGQRTSIRLTRTELEQLLDDPLDGFLAALDDTLDRNGVQPAHVSAVATIGGGARIPLLTQRLSQHLRTLVVTTPHPQLTAAAGASLLATSSQSDETATTLTPTAPAVAAAPPTVAAAVAPAALAWSEDPGDVTDVVAPPAPVEFSRPSVEFGEHDWNDVTPRRRGPLVAFGASAAAAIAALAVFGMTQFDGETAPASSASSIAVSSAPVAPATSQPVVAPVAETSTAVVTPPPRLIPVGGPRPQQPAPQTVTVAPVTTPATPTTTTTTTPATTSKTTPTTTTPTSTTTPSPPTSTPEMTIKTIPIDPGPGSGK
ncbi:MAG: molecular chaperone [Mycobacterium sp.]|nr:molecular chaperone [Mycobacterium sp.]